MCIYPFKVRFSSVKKIVAVIGWFDCAAYYSLCGRFLNNKTVSILLIFLRNTCELECLVELVVLTLVWFGVGLNAESLLESSLELFVFKRTRLD